MRAIHMKKTKATAATLALLVGSGVAVAYWTGGGSGTGTATTGSAASLSVEQTSGVSNLRPGAAAATLSGRFDNPSASPIYVTSVTVSISGVTKASGAVAGTCDATDYTIAGTNPMIVGAEVAPGQDEGSWTGATIAFNNKAGVNQDACKGATVNLAYSVL